MNILLLQHYGILNEKEENIPNQIANKEINTNQIISLNLNKPLKRKYVAGYSEFSSMF